MSTYEYDPENGIQPVKVTKKKKKKEQEISWFAIIIGFAVFWPVGLAFLIMKLVQMSEKAGSDSHQQARQRAAEAAMRRQISREQARVDAQLRKMEQSQKKDRAKTFWLQALGIFLVFGGVALGSDAMDMLRYTGSLDIMEIFTALGFLAGGASCWFMGKSTRKRQQRCVKYLAAIGPREAVEIGELATVFGLSRKAVLEDLEYMMEKKILPESAYVDLSRDMLYLSAYAAQEAAQKRAQERKTAAREPAPQETEEGYSGILRQIRRANDEIADPVLSQKIDRLEEIAGKIFKIVEEKPQRKKEISTFLDYYLPTTQKLLDAYSEFEAAGVEGENLREAKRRIEEIMETVVEGFERQLDQLYRCDAMDIDSEIRVMETMLKRDGGSVEQDFFGSAAVQKQGE